MSSPPRLLLAVVALTSLAPAAGCVHRGYFTDGSSLSLGNAVRGVLIHGRELGPAGPGFVVPRQWVTRGHLWGTDELVSAVTRAAASVDSRLPGGTLGVGDLSIRGGGRATHHRSHVSGRDADLIFYATDEAGAPVPPPDAMPRYRSTGTSRPPREGNIDYSHNLIAPRRFDFARNWALVEALVTDETIDVEYLFIAERLKDRLIDWAEHNGAGAEALARARRALRGPSGRTLPHDDHFHIRIRCSTGDKALGCVDEGRVRLRVERVPGPATS